MRWVVAIVCVTAALETGCGGDPTPTPVSDACPADACRSGGCPDGWSRCGEACVDTTRDPSHCGGCGFRCRTSEVCDGAGRCIGVCLGDRTRCGPVCVDLWTDAANCGGCDVACASDEVCSDGGCALSCRAPETACAGACLDVSQSDESCGGCPGTAPGCAAGEGCWEGACRAHGTVAWSAILVRPRGGVDEYARSVDTDTSGNILVAGATSRGDRDFYYAKLDAAGTVRWDAEVDLGGLNELHAAAFTSEGEVVLGGWRSLDSPLRVAFWVDGLDADGGSRWAEPTVLDRGFGTLARDLAVDATGNVYVAGEQSAGGVFDSLFAKLDADGRVMWAFTADVLGRGGSDRAFSVSLDSSGRPVFSGASEEPTGVVDAWVRALDVDGTERWTRRVHSGEDDRLFATAIDARGRIYAVGKRGDESASRVVVLRFRADGAADAAHEWDAAPGDNAALGVAIDGRDHPIVVGQLGVVGTLDGFAWALDAAELSRVRWADSIAGPRDDSFVDVAVDRWGNVVAAGYSYNAVDRDLWVRKYVQ